MLSPGWSSLASTLQPEAIEAIMRKSLLAFFGIMLITLSKYCMGTMHLL